MKKLGLALVVAAAVGAGTAVINTAQAAPAGISGQLGAAAASFSIIEKTQFIFGGQEYCWYDDGWHGTGWYWCGYALRQGFGWGGPVGWHNWDRHNPPRLHGPGSSHNPSGPVFHPPAHPPIPRHPHPAPCVECRH